jgi:hypothetical protein
MIRLTSKGDNHVPQALHHFAAWGGLKELLRVRGGAITRAEASEVLKFCAHPNPKHDPNVDYLDYALGRGWLREE